MSLRRILARGASKPIFDQFRCANAAIQVGQNQVRSDAARTVESQDTLLEVARSTLPIYRYNLKWTARVTRHSTDDMLRQLILHR